MTRSYRGVISYGHETAAQTGRETFHVTVHDDGTRTLRCVCEMDNVPLVRDVVYTVNDRFEAIDAFVRVHSQGAFVGSGWFHFSETLAEGEVITAGLGRLSQRIETPSRVKLLGSHPICVDIWKCAHTPAERAGEIQPLSNCFSSSLVPNGASGPLLAAKTYDMAYLGEATVATPAGQFDGLRYSWDTHTGRTLVMHTIPGDWLALRVHVPETGRLYQLVEYQEIER